MGKAVMVRAGVLALLLGGGLLAAVLPARSQEVPIGKPRTAAEFSADLEQLLFDRRISRSDLAASLPRVAFKVAACMKCHENRPGVEGQVFYGPNYSDFGKDQKTENRAIPAKRIAPGRNYDFVKTHEKRQKLWVGGTHEQLIKQNW